MEFETVREFAKFENQRLEEKFSFSGKDRRIMAGMIKITEEVGELSNEVLHLLNYQRQTKDSVPDNIKEEFADVLLTVFLLAEVLDVSLENEILKKIEKIKKREY
ncbi:MazG-like family protein [Candidatus Woesearchaeota archaeon]|nr:MazG-like family protein [Candidatus Woesearchaeota archaeon]